MSVALVLATSCVVAQASDPKDAWVTENVKLLRHSNPEFRGMAARELASLGPKSRAAIPALIAALGDERAGRITGSIVNPAVAQFASEALHAIGPEVIPPLLKELREQADPVRRVRVVETLSRFAERRPCPDGLIGGLGVALRDPDWEVRRSAIVGLRQAGRSAVPEVPRLLEVLKRDPSALVRVVSARALASVDPEGTTCVGPLIAALKDEDVAVRGAAAGALGTLGRAGRSAVPALIEALKDKSYRGLADAPDIVGAVTFRAVRCDVIDALGQMGSDARSALPALGDLLVRDRVHEVRARAAVALLRIDPRETKAIPALIQMLDGARGNGAMPAVSALADLGPRAKDAGPALLRALEHGDTTLRLGVIEALGAIGEAAAIRALDGLRADPDLEVRDAAERALEALVQPKQ